MNPTFYSKSGAFRAGGDFDSVKDKLPKGVYRIGKDDSGYFWFIPYGSMDVPKKIYGNVAEQAAHDSIKAFDFRGKSTGVLLSGVSGSGKTLAAKLIAHQLMEARGYPVIIVDGFIPGQDLSKALGQVEQPMVVIFEEIEKNYSKTEEAESLLTLFDGVIPGHRMVVATCNEPNKLPQWFFNRPSRFYYHFRYGGYEEAAVTEMLEDMFLTQKQRTALNFFAHATDLPLDAAMGVAAEMQHRGENETLSTVLSRLNIELADVDTNHTSRYFTFYNTNGEKIGKYYDEIGDSMAVNIQSQSVMGDYGFEGSGRNKSRRKKAGELIHAETRKPVTIYAGNYIRVKAEWEDFTHLRIDDNGAIHLEGDVLGVYTYDDDGDDDGKAIPVVVTVRSTIRRGKVRPIVQMARTADSYAEGNLKK